MVLGHEQGVSVMLLDKPRQYCTMNTCTFVTSSFMASFMSEVKHEMSLSAISVHSCTKTRHEARVDKGHTAVRGAVRFVFSVIIKGQRHA